MTLGSSMQIGEYYHVPGSSRITKVDWHPWGEGGASLLVLTSDGQLRYVAGVAQKRIVFTCIYREYDVAKDPSEPQQTVELLALPQNKLKYDVSASAEAVSFCIGRGSADWSPFTVYALTTEGEVWATCPFLPANAYVLMFHFNKFESDISILILGRHRYHISKGSSILSTQRARAYPQKFRDPSSNT